MGAFTLTNGALLGGLALLAAPVIAHLLQRRARRPIVFPSIAFLRECAAQQSRLQRIKRLILLSLRMFAVAGIVMAFTRPVWLSSQLAAQTDRQSAAAVVLIIDASLSTSQQAGAGPLFDRLRTGGNRVIDELRSGVDLADVVVADESPRAIFPRLSLNLPALQTELAALASGETRADFGAALGIAARLLEAHSGPRKLVVLSDFQASNWLEELATGGAGVRLPEGTEIIFSDSGSPPPGNVGLSAPECFPAIPAAGQTVDLTVSILNSGDDTRQSTVALEVAGLGGGAPVHEEQTIILNPRASRRVTFAVLLPAGALHTATFRLKEADGLPGDDRTWLAIGSAQPAPVLIVSDDSPDEPATAAFYIERALAPYEGLADITTAGRFAVRHVRSAQLTADDLKGVSALFLGYLGVLTEEQAKLIAEYVRAGGGLVQFCGDGPADKNVALLNTVSVGRMTPWLLSSRRTFTRSDAPVRITSGRWQSKWFREFDEQSQLAMQEIGFKSIWNTGAAGVDTEVLLLFSNGRPALGSRAYGRGQFLLANFSPEAASSDLGKHGPFVALTQIIAATLHRSEEQRSNLVGEQVRFATSVPSMNYRVTGPGAQPIAASRSEGVDGGRVMVNRAERSGLYTLEIDEIPAGAVAVNIDPRESDLIVADTGAIEERLRASGISGTAAIRRVSESGGLDLQGRPLWGEFFTLAMAAIAVELMLLGYWRR